MDLVEFKEEWSKHAKEERRRYDSLPVDTLLDDIKNERYGDYYQIWDSLAARADFRQAGLTLLEVLESNADPLVRSYYASAFISLAHLSESWRPEHLSAERKFPVQDNLQKVRRIVQDKLKPDERQPKGNR